MSTLRIFSHDIGNTTYEVWVTNGIVQYVIGGVIQYDMDSVSDFLAAAAKEINKPNSTDDVVVESTGNISDDALENYEDGAVTYDAGGSNTSPFISLQDDDTEVKITGGGVGGQFRVDFGTGNQAKDEAEKFLNFANDLLGKATATELEQITGVQIGDFTRTVTVSQRDDDITQIKFKSTGETKDLQWADAYIDLLGESLGGTKTNNGNVSETGFTANQTNIKADGVTVNLGPQGVGGKEEWVFGSEADAQAFFDDVKATFGPGGDTSMLLDEVIEDIAAGLGATQVRDGRVNSDYEARQIRLIEKDDGVFVDLGSHKVGGKERYDFGTDTAAALEFIGTVRDLVGVEAQDGRVVDEFIFKVSGGAGISGSPTFVGNDDFIEFIGAEFGGVQTRDGSVSESFGGGGRIIGDGTEVQLGPKGVGGKEVWDFDTAADAMAFIDTLDAVFG